MGSSRRLYPVSGGPAKPSPTLLLPVLLYNGSSNRRLVRRPKMGRRLGRDSISAQAADSQTTIHCECIQASFRYRCELLGCLIA